LETHEKVYAAISADGVRPSEAKVAFWLMQGFCNKRIARELRITESTVKVHVSSLLRISGSTNRVQLTNYLYKSVLNEPRRVV
jgi:two-component system, NarL family, nitrate/nitrite response regulator NarL